MFKFGIKPDDGEPYEVEAGSRDVLVWEKTNKGKSLQTLMETTAMSDLYKLAHIASKRTGQFDGTLAEFETSCELEFDESEEEDPTQPAP